MRIVILTHFSSSRRVPNLKNCISINKLTRTLRQISWTNKYNQEARSSSDVYGPRFQLESIFACNGDWSSPACEDFIDSVFLGEAS